MADFDQTDTFESSWGNWNNTGGDQDWTRTNAATPSGSTGADQAYAGSYYAFTEVSSPVSNNEEFYLTSNSVNAGMYALSISFYYHAWGEHCTYLAVEVSKDGGDNWDTPLWTITSQTHTAAASTDPYDQQIVDLDAAGYKSGNILIRIRTKTPSSGNVYYGDFCLDNIRIYGDVRPSYTVSGITKDKNGTALGSCHCFLCKDNLDNTITYRQYILSNVTTGAYSFTVYDDDAQYFIISWKDDTPHVFDVTDHVLQGT